MGLVFSQCSRNADLLWGLPFAIGNKDAASFNVCVGVTRLGARRQNEIFQVV
jgi:hypothetical protein